MKITVTGSLGNISKPLTQKLVKAGHDVTVISSDAAKTAEIEALGAKAAIGLLADADFVTKAFTGADVAYTMVPPNFAAEDYRKYVGNAAKVYTEAIKASGVKRIVNLSSIGAHIDGGTGQISGVHDAEKVLNQLDGVAIKHVRAGFFYTNFYSNVPMIKQGFIGANYGSDTRLLLVSPNDIADVVTEELQGNFTGKSVRYIISDEHTAGEAAQILGDATGSPDLKWVEFTDEQSYNGMLQGGLTPELARNFTEMGSAIRAGILWEDFDATGAQITGQIKLEEFAKQFAHSL